MLVIATVTLSNSDFNTIFNPVCGVSSMMITDVNATYRCEIDSTLREMRMRVVASAYVCKYTYEQM